MQIFLANFFFIFFLVFTGCSNKQYYTPEHSHLEDKRIPFIFKRGEKLERVENDRVILSTGEIFNRDGDKIENIEQNISSLLKDEVVWTKESNLIAYVTDGNLIALYDLNRKQNIFQERFSPAPTIDRRLPPPLFNDNTILYFTLDGKIAIFSIKEMKIKRVISAIGSGEDYSNIISYQLRDSDLTLITHRGAMVIGDNFDESIKLELRGAIYEDNSIILITKDGDVRRYSRNLILQNHIKFPLAYFVAFGEVGDKIYLIESQGYVIELDRDFKNYRVIPSELDDENCFFTPKRFICDEKFFRLPLSI